MKQATLTVFYENTPVGTISRGKTTEIVFAYDENWKKNGFPLSVSMGFDLPADDLIQNAAHFFRNMLPEGPNLNQMCRNAKIDRSDTFGFLSVYGRECAGAISVYASNIAPACENYRSIVDITDKVTTYVKSRVQGQPAHLQSFLRDSFSLAGAQDKFQCIVQGNRLYMPQKESGVLPSHIVKPDWSFAVNEYFCTKFAESIGLPVHRATLIKFDAFCVVAFERYDRLSGKRLHQEDMCQALGRFDFQKYEHMTGGVTFADIAEIMKINLGKDSRKSMASMTIFNALIGNGDAHAKNFSFLYDFSGQVSLAPFYDIASSTVDGFDDSFAMKIGHANSLEELTAGDLSVFALDMELTELDICNICKDMHVGISEMLDPFLGKMQRAHPEYENYFMQIAKIIADRIEMFEPTLNEFSHILEMSEPRL